MLFDIVSEWIPGKNERDEIKVVKDGTVTNTLFFSNAFRTALDKESLGYQVTVINNVIKAFEQMRREMANFIDGQPTPTHTMVAYAAGRLYLNHSPAPTGIGIIYGMQVHLVDDQARIDSYCAVAVDYELLAITEKLHYLDETASLHFPKEWS